MTLVDLTLLTPPFSGDEVIVVVPAPVTDDFLTSLRRRLKAVPALSPLVEVYLTTSPPAAEFPFLVIDRVSQVPFLNSTDSYYKEVACRFTVDSRDCEEADALGSAAYDALFPEDEKPPLVFAGGYEMTRTPGPTRGPEAQTWGTIEGDPVWRYRFEYTFLVGKN